MVDDRSPEFRLDLRPRVGQDDSDYDLGGPPYNVTAERASQILKEAAVILSAIFEEPFKPQLAASTSGSRHRRSGYPLKIRGHDRETAS